MPEEQAISYYTLGPEIYSQEWFDLRTYDENRNPPFVLGASFAGVACGVSKWKTALEGYHEIRGERPLREESESMLWGKLHEQNILNEYSRRMQCPVTKPTQMFISVRTPFIGASLDGLGHDDDGLFAIEVKCTTSRMYDQENWRERDCFGEELTDQIPSDYLMQVHQQMYVHGSTRCDLPVLFDGNKLRVYSVQRNDAIVTALVTKLTHFYTRVCNEDEPDPDWSHDSTVALLKDLYRVDEGLKISLGEEGCLWYDRYVAAGEDAKLAEGLKQEALAHILAEMGECEVAELPGTGHELRRGTVEELYWDQKDIDKAQQMLGQVKRKGYSRLYDKKVK
jgi:putative phage-type endonuclease